MQKKLWTIGMLVAMAISGINFQKLPAGECSWQTIEGLYQEELNGSGVAFLASLEDLYFDKGAILLNVEGFLYSVHSLTRAGTQWLATVVNDNNVNYCQSGHLTCRGCGLCHKSGCRYYVRPCKLWDKE